MLASNTHACKQDQLLGNNKLFGGLPAELCTCTVLSFLDIWLDLRRLGRAAALSLTVCQNKYVQEHGDNLSMVVVLKLP